MAGLPSSSARRLVARCTRGAQITSVAVAAVGATVCVGWIFDVPTLVRLHPTLAAMKLNTGLVLILLGAALRLSIPPGDAPRAARALTIAAAAIAAATLVEYALDIDLGIDQLLVGDRDAHGTPGRMAPATAACLFTLGVAVRWLDARWSAWLCLLTALTAHIAVLGYLYGVRDLYAIGPYSTVALHTAVAIYGLAVAAVLARPTRGAMRLVTSDSPGGVLARRLVPPALVVPAMLALLGQWGEQAGVYGTAFGRAMLVASSSVTFVALIAWTAAAIVRSDERRRAAEARLRALAQVSDAFAAVATSYQPLLDAIAGTVTDIVGDGCLVTLISDDGDHLYSAANAHRDAALGADYRAYLATMLLSRTSAVSVSGTVARTGQPLRADVSPADMVARSPEALRPLVARLDVHGYAVVPIRARGTVIGTLSVLRNVPGHSYTDEDVTLLQDLGDRAGLAIENARLYAQLEQRVDERTAELEAANAQLESFSYSVAHDLRAPLRAISGFSHALLEDAAERLAADDVRHATLIRDAALRMNELIDALLELSRISRTEPSRRVVDVSALARGVIAELRAAQPERDVEVVIADGLAADADPRLIEIVLTNLLGNAWKFTGRRAGARIELGVRPDEQPAVYFVRDNGAGFDPAHAGKLFGVFQRLHAARDFDGSGIGLATVHRIVHRHGGRIGAEAEVDRGATFYFTLQPSALTARAALPRSPS
ncbi:MAG TPA: ATP-binding protein [Kofleriaceae bacterium]